MSASITFAKGVRGFFCGLVGLVTFPFALGYIVVTPMRIEARDSENSWWKRGLYGLGALILGGIVALIGGLAIGIGIGGVCASAAYAAHQGYNHGFKAGFKAPFTIGFLKFATDLPGRICNYCCGRTTTTPSARRNSFSSYSSGASSGLERYCKEGASRESSQNSRSRSSSGNTVARLRNQPAGNSESTPNDSGGKSKMRVQSKPIQSMKFQTTVAEKQQVNDLPPLAKSWEPSNGGWL